MKDRLAGKEWSVFTANLNEARDNDEFSTIYPLYGSYYYFFPEVNGTLKVRFYCEGEEETPAFWYKQKEVNGVTTVVDQDPPMTKSGVNTDGRTTNSSGNYYEFTVTVEKGGVYYLCSLPTNINHEHPILRLTSYAFVPAFRLDPLWYVATDDEKSSGTIARAAELNEDFVHPQGDVSTWKMTWECLGNIKSAEPYFDDNDKVLKFKDIVYKSVDNPALNDGGVVIVNMSCASGKATYVLTVPYSAEKAVMSTDANNHAQRVRDTDSNRNPGGKEVKKWDFFSNTLDIGQYKNTSSQLYEEIHKADGLTADWVNTYMNLRDNSEPIFKSVYDMEGDNADMLKETEGLIFLTHSNHLGIYNENDPANDSFQDRYIGILGEGELWVPGLHEGDRIVIKMGRYGESATGSNAHFEVENAKDAVGTAISGEYVIGGSHRLDDGQDQSIPYGEYHFISTGGHFKLKVKDAPLVKFYSIVIYKNSVNPDNILSENNVLGTNREILYTDRDGGQTKNATVNLHHWGLAETQKMLDIPLTYNTGKFKTDEPEFSTTDNHHFTCTPAHGKFGSFRVRVGVQSSNNAYITDYADYDLAVGYRETKTYPYTWDFTDLRSYVTKQMDNGTERNVTFDDLKVRDNYGLRVRSEECQNGCIFVSGSQLYADQSMFPETAGLGIHHYNNDIKRNYVMTMTEGGLKINDSNVNTNNSPINPLFWGFIVPEVSANQAIYVHAKKVTGAKVNQAKYTMNDPMGVYSFDLEGTAVNYIPAGWTCVQEDNGIHIPNNDYSGGGARVFVGFTGYQGKALYWRNNYAAYGLQDNNKLYLKPGTYNLTFVMAAWKGTPSYKVVISKYGGEDIVSSETFTASPNADGNNKADISVATPRVLSFTIKEAAEYIIKFSDMTEGSGFHEFLLLQCDLTTPEHEFEYTGTDANGDDIFAMHMPSDASTSDVKLCFQGYEINKIAVSTARKQFNIKGWTTESRDYDIDPSLTAYMNGRDIKTYLVTGVDYTKNTVTMTDISNEGLMHSATDGSKYACILRNTEDAELNIVNNGFYLFVPDMHDARTAETPLKNYPTSMESSMMKAQVSPATIDKNNSPCGDKFLKACVPREK